MHCSNLHRFSAARLGLCLLFASALFLFAESPAYAFTPPSGVVNLCIFYANLVTNSIAKGTATLAVVALALGAMFGKVTWGMAILVAVGISALFGANALAQLAGGGC